MSEKINKEMLATLVGEKEYWEKEWCKLNKLLAEKEKREAELLSLLKEALIEWEGNWELRWSKEKPKPWLKHPRIEEIRKKISKAE